MKLLGVVFTPDAANDVLELKDDDNSGDLKIYLRLATAKTSVPFDFGPDGINFPNGIYVSTITAGAKATLIIRGAGG